MSQQSVDKVVGQSNNVKDINVKDSLVLENSASFTNQDLPYTDMRYNDTKYHDVTTQEDKSDLYAMIDSHSPKVLEALKDLVGSRFPEMQFVSYEKLNDSVVIQVTPSSSTVRVLTVEESSEGELTLPLSVITKYVTWYLQQNLGVLWRKF